MLHIAVKSIIYLLCMEDLMSTSDPHPSHPHPEPPQHWRQWFDAEQPWILKDQERPLRVAAMLLDV
jgi:hypothetical protein